MILIKRSIFSILFSILLANNISGAEDKQEDFSFKAQCSRYDTLQDLFDLGSLKPYQQVIDITRLRLNFLLSALDYLLSPNTTFSEKTQFCISQNWIFEKIVAKKNINEVLKDLSLDIDDVMDHWGLKKVEEIHPEVAIASSFLIFCEIGILQWRFFYQSLLNLQDCEAQSKGLLQLFKEAHILCDLSEMAYSKARTRYNHDQIFFSRCLLDGLSFCMYESNLLTGHEQDIASIFVSKPLSKLPWNNSSKVPACSSNTLKVHDLINHLEGARRNALPTEIRERLMDSTSNFFAPETPLGLGSWFTQCNLEPHVVLAINHKFQKLEENESKDLQENESLYEEFGDELSQQPCEEAPKPPIEVSPNPAYGVDLEDGPEQNSSDETAASEQSQEDIATTEELNYDDEDVMKAVKTDYCLSNERTTHIHRLHRLMNKKDPEMLRLKQALSYFLTPENPEYLKRNDWKECLTRNTGWVSICQNIVLADVTRINQRLKRKEIRLAEKREAAKASFLPINLQKGQGRKNGKVKNGQVAEKETQIISSTPPAPLEIPLANIKIEFRHIILPIFRELKPRYGELELYKWLLTQVKGNKFTWTELMLLLKTSDWNFREIGNSFCLLYPPEWFSCVTCSGEGATSLRQNPFVLPYPPESVDAPLTKDCLALLKTAFERDLGLTNLMLEALVLHLKPSNEEAW